jgi:hypothetical protein
MDRITYLEALLADYIARVSELTREDLIQEVIELKSQSLDLPSSEDTLQHHYAGRHIIN